MQKQEALTEGIIFKTVNLINFALLGGSSVLLVWNFDQYEFKNPTLTTSMICLLACNIIVPLIVINLVPRESLRDYIREPT